MLGGKDIVCSSEDLPDNPNNKARLAKEMAVLACVNGDILKKITSEEYSNGVDIKVIKWENDKGTSDFYHIRRIIGGSVYMRENGFVERNLSRDERVARGSAGRPEVIIETIWR